MKKNKNNLLYICFFITLLICLFFIFGNGKAGDLSIKITNPNETQSSTFFTEGSNTVNVVGAFEYNKEKYKYTGSFHETYLNIELYNNDKLESTGVKKGSTGLIAYELGKDVVSFRIDYMDSYDEKNKHNQRDYTINIEYKKIKKEINKTIIFEGINNNPMDGIDFISISKEAGILK